MGWLLGLSIVLLILIVGCYGLLALVLWRLVPALVALAERLSRPHDAAEAIVWEAATASAIGGRTMNRPTPNGTKLSVGRWRCPILSTTRRSCTPPIGKHKGATKSPGTCRGFVV